MDIRIFHLIGQMSENLSHQWTVEELAKLADVSVPHLQRLFKSETRTSPIKYLHNLRLDRARELLEVEDKYFRINEICYEVGMHNKSYFTGDFKTKFRATPTEYRKQYWEKVLACRHNGQK